MNNKTPVIDCPITFFYYRDLSEPIEFYEDILRLEPTLSKTWAKIYYVNTNAFLGIVDEEKGFHSAGKTNAVLLTFIVNDIESWYNRLEGRAKIVKDLKKNRELKIQSFFIEDPGGYILEIQKFLDPNEAKLFHNP